MQRIEIQAGPGGEWQGKYQSWTHELNDRNDIYSQYECDLRFVALTGETEMEWIRVAEGQDKGSLILTFEGEQLRASGEKLHELFDRL